MNKKFIALSMLMFASWSSNVVSSGAPVAARSMSSHVQAGPQQPLKIDSYNKSGSQQPARVSYKDSAAEGVRYLASFSGMDDRGIVDKMFGTTPKPASARRVDGTPEAQVFKQNDKEIPALDLNQSDANLVQTDLVFAQPVAADEQNGVIADYKSMLESERNNPQKGINSQAPSYYDRAARLGQQAKNGAYTLGKSMYEAPGIAFERTTGGQRDFLSNPVNGSVRSLAFGKNKNTQIKNKEEFDNFLNSDAFANKQEPVYKKTNETDGSFVEIYVDNKGNRLMKYSAGAAGDGTYQLGSNYMYTPATAMNLPARTIAALYDKLPTLSTQNGRQEFKANVSAMLKRSDNEQPTARTWNEFFASIKPDMNFLSFDNLFSNLFNKKASTVNKTDINAEAAPVAAAEGVNGEVLNPLAITPLENLGDVITPDFTGFDVNKLKKDIQPRSEAALNEKMTESYAGSNATKYNNRFS